MDHVEPLKRAVEICGGQIALASKIGRTQQYISFLLNHAKKMDGQVALDIEDATCGQVTAKELCPRVFARRVSA